MSLVCNASASCQHKSSSCVFPYTKGATVSICIEDLCTGEWQAALLQLSQYYGTTNLCSLVCCINVWSFYNMTAATAPAVLILQGITQKSQTSLGMVATESGAQLVHGQDKQMHIKICFASSALQQHSGYLEHREGMFG